MALCSNRHTWFLQCTSGGSPGLWRVRGRRSCVPPVGNRL